MGAFTFENQALGAFLVYHLDEQECLDQLAIGMLTHNRIPGILPVNNLLVDGKHVVRFRVSSLTALMGYWGGTIGRQKLLSFLTSFCKAILECQEYMLDPSHILLAWDQVFVDPLSGEARLAYLPVLEGAVKQPAPEEFLKDLLQRTTFAPDEDSSHIPVLLNAVHMPNFSVEAFYEQLKKLTAQPVRPAQAAPQPVRPAQAAPQPVRPVQAAPQPVRPVQAAPQSVRPAQAAPQPVRPVQAAPQPVQAANGGEKKKGFFGFGGKTEKESKKNAGKTGQASGGPAFAVPGMEPEKAVKEKKGLFGKKQEAVQPAPQPVRPVQPVSPAPQPVRPVQPVSPAPQPVRPVRGGGETVLLSDDGAARTVSLEDMGEETQQPEIVSGKLALVRRLTGERVVIDKPIFHVGRESRVVEFCLTGGHDWVGTDHAYFLQKPDGTYLVDNNSLNHTWLNGQQLVSNQPCLVRQGDVIKMADEEFDVLPG